MINDYIRFRVYGLPGAQGSKHARPIYRGNGATRQFTGKVAQQEQSRKVAPWRSDVKAAAEAALPDGWVLYDGPIAVQVVFIFARPKSHYGTGRNAHLLRDGAASRPTGKNVGDLDKLQRSTFDALTAAGVWGDDSQVVDVFAQKVYGRRPGAFVTISPAPRVTDFPDDQDYDTGQGGN